MCLHKKVNKRLYSHSNYTIKKKLLRKGKIKKEVNQTKLIKEKD